MLLPSFAARADDLSNAENKANGLNGSIGAKQKEIANLQSEEAKAQAQLVALNAQIVVAERELTAANARLDSILGAIEETKRQLAAKKADLARRTDLFRRRTRSMYKQGGNETWLDSIFSASSFSELMDRFIVMRDITHSDRLLMEELARDRADIEALGERQAKQRDEQKAQVNAVEAMQSGLQQRYSQQAALKARLHSTELTLAEQVAQAKKALAQVNAEIAALKEARKRARSSGVFAWPVAACDSLSCISQGFGCTNFPEPPPPDGYSCPGSRPYFHAGIDIAGPYGSEVTSADGGIAYTYASGYGYGNHVIVVHANGYTTLYGHLAAFAISSGTAVGKGQRIGFEGSTGYSTGAHVHFEVRLNDNPQNPCRYVGC
jgi:murein DD-endopeptidase MepM/ murein hydrolase activator NlpD